MSVVYDAGALVAADRSNRQVWADHRVRLELGIAPTTTAPVVAQVSRSGHQAQLRRFLRGCEIVALTADHAHPVGALLGRADATDVVDAHVVLTASRRSWPVITSDADDLRRLAATLPEPVRIQTI